MWRYYSEEDRKGLFHVVSKSAHNWLLWTATNVTILFRRKCSQTGIHLPLNHLMLFDTSTAMEPNTGTVHPLSLPDDNDFASIRKYSVTITSRLL